MKIKISEVKKTPAVSNLNILTCLIFIVYILISYLGLVENVQTKDLIKYVVLTFLCGATIFSFWKIIKAYKRDNVIYIVLCLNFIFQIMVLFFFTLMGDELCL